MFTLLLCLSAFLVAGSAAYFSVLGIATLFSGSYIEVMIMAGALELGKLVATSYLHQYWHETKFLLKSYLSVAVLVLMCITSLGIFGFLSSAYQENSAKFAHVDSQMVLLEKQKVGFDKELEQIANRIQTLNESRSSQEKRLPNLSRLAAAPIYKDIEKAGEEIKSLSERSVEIQNKKNQNDNEIIELNKENSKSRDIGTFKFVAGAVDKPLDTVVTWFIAVIMSVFDPLAVALILAVNVVIGRKSVKKKLIIEEPLPFIEPKIKEQTEFTAVENESAQEADSFFYKDLELFSLKEKKSNTITIPINSVFSGNGNVVNNGHKKQKRN